MNIKCIAGIALILFSNFIYAEEKTSSLGLIAQKNNMPTEIIADETEWNRTANQVIARGNASIKQGGSIVKAPHITGYFSENGGQRRLDYAVAKGNVHLTHADKVMTSNQVTAYFKDIEGARKLSKAVGLGNVHITTPTQTVLGDKVTYEPKDDVAVLEGNVTLTQDQNRIKGDWAKADFVTGDNIIRADKSKNGQVRGLLFSHKEKAKKS